MLKNYLLTAIRSLRRQKGYAVINVAGLAIGLACCLLISLFVLDELSYDRIHEPHDRLFRLVGNDFGAVGWPYGRILEEEFPEVETVTYLRTWPTFSFEHGGERHFEPMAYADADFFDLFDFPLLKGAHETALAEPYTVVLSEPFARTLFGDDAALGRTLTIADTVDLTVTGVARVPRQSHIQFDALLSFETLRALDPESFDEQLESGWLNLNVVNYVRLREGTDAEAFAEKIHALPMERAADYLRRWGGTYHLNLQPLREVYLHPELGNTLGPQGDIASVRLLGAIGLFVLLLAGINFINLATARSTERAREVGVRKAIGSSRRSLVHLFLTESLLTTLLGLGGALFLASLALPVFNGLTDRSYTLGDLATPGVGLALLGLVLTVGVLSGLYPALALSSFRPTEALKGSFRPGRRGLFLRKGLVVVQFAISCTLIVATLAALSQLRYMQRQNLGFDEEQVVVLDARKVPSRERARRLDALTQVLQDHPAVQHTAATYAVPGTSGWYGQISFPEGWPEGQSLDLEYLPVNYGFADALGLEVVAGRAFDARFAADAEQSVMINEAAVEAAGWASPADAVGKGFTSPGSGKPDGVVIGVVKDYHHHGLRDAIGPMMYGINPAAAGQIALRLRTAEAAPVVAHLERTWKSFFPSYPFEYFFLDEAFAAQYVQEQRQAKIFGGFAGLAVLVACLGLFGLAAFTARRRTKEIGIRKVLGASVPSVVALLSREFLLLVLTAFALATPVAYLLAQRWLEDFAYRVRLGPEVFLLAGALALGISLLTVSYHALRAATADPVEALRYE